jgi:two-component system sensor histidine kinase KdpD
MQRQQDGRPHPETLLKQLIQLSGGRHKIFVSFAPGAGKTYRLLGEARALVERGVDLVVGWVDTHGRAETEALLAGLEVIPPRPVVYQGATFAEMDLDGILERRPATVVVDELAHTNAPGSRNSKRYEDVEVLLKAGISVISAMNIQHLESVAETAGRLIGAPVSERVPDRVLREAEEVQLVDASPELILERLAQGKVYAREVPATGNFFRHSTLVYLRELALRTVAQKVDTELLTRSSHGVAGPAGVRERVLVAVSTNPVSERLIRRGAAITRLLDAEFVVAYVRTREPDAQARQVLDAHLRLTREHGGEFVILEGKQIAEVLTRFVVERNITQLVVGESMRSPWEELVHGSVVNRLLRSTSNLDVLIVGETESAGTGVLPKQTTGESVARTAGCFVDGYQERRSRGCGRHRVYLGAAPGVGKTYAMLKEAHDLLGRGIDVVVGIVETHGRAETAVLIDGLEVIPKLQVTYQGRLFAEMDREAVLRRSPMIALVDELAHTNIPGTGTIKRYQDVEILLSHGIDVISTLNVQHLESLNTLVERTTGVKVRETVPDYVLEAADEVVLIDLPADELCQRLREGKIYALSKVEQALSNFFRPENLSALRELALREVADELGHRQPEAAGVPAGGAETLLVCVNLRPNAQQLIRRGARIAKRLTARFLVAHIAPSKTIAPEQRSELDKLRRLVEELGGTWSEEVAPDPAQAIVALTGREAVTKLVLGESRRSALEEALKGSVIERVLRRTRNLDTLIVGNFERDPFEGRL